MSAENPNQSGINTGSLYRRRDDPDQTIAEVNDARDYGGHVIDPGILTTAESEEPQGPAQLDLLSTPQVPEYDVVVEALEAARAHLPNTGSVPAEQSRRAATVALNKAAGIGKLGPKSWGNPTYR